MPYEDESGALVRFYDGDYAHARTPSGDVAFYVEEARRAGGAVLELGCGTGRVLVPTVAAGVDATGLDRSEGMLALARVSLARAGVHATLVRGDMADFALERRFALVTIPFRALSHVLEADDHVRVFEGVRRHMTPGGRLIFDVFLPDPARITAPAEERLDFERTDAEGRTVRRYGRVAQHPARQRSDVTFRWEVDGVAAGAARFTMRWFHHFEVVHLLARCGFEVEAVHGGFDRRPFAEGVPEQIFVARPA
jgi:SAM-dependent methyltransferase